MNTYGVIMAGGGGTRFWPLSREKTPKQLLNLSGRDVMINETLDRIARVAARENIFIVTNVAQADKTRSVTAGRVPAENILSEPAARNTAACIGYAAVKILRERGDGIMVITPSDAYIKDESEYVKVLKTAIAEAETSDNLITIGITPTFPATGYGYIRFETSDSPVKNVLQFVEKPDYNTAVGYIESGCYAWNSGVFVWKASVILRKFKEYLPDIYAELEIISENLGTEREISVLNEIYPRIRPISVDYGIMEKADNIKVISGEFGWSDVGSWDMLGALHTGDDNGNIAVGDTLMIATSNSVIYSGGRLVATVGVDNLVVVETPDAVLVMPKDRAQDVKKVVEALRTEGREELL